MIKVLIVDDSAVVRQVLSAVLSKDPQIKVIATASDPIIAKDKMALEWPDVIVLDIEMPRMDGITFLKIIMAERPTPVVICSTLTEKGAETTLQAMAAGAVCYVTKPKLGLKDFLADSATELINNVRVAAQSRPRRFVTAVARPLEQLRSLPVSAAAMAHTTERIVAIGTSTGGTQALEVVLTALPRVTPGIVIVQHMPEKFTASFANRLNDLCAVEVREAKEGDRVIPGCALIAPGGLHMRLTRSGAYYHVNVLDGPPVNRHKPSVDVLFKSVAQIAGRNALGIIMTGMGDDGARGLRDMHDAGAYTLAQDEASCVVFGMPKEAIKLDAVDAEQPLERIAGEIMRFAK
ncbi:MAG: chemotaxis response regulator protein-glutamate methylesterase [Methylovulum sp.]|jgi:two-component system chemotaxis response regulator CheB|nr:MAG: chemotaxis response regulator protein-glutamate methylesterase [Methylovulum sp.]